MELSAATAIQDFGTIYKQPEVISPPLIVVPEETIHIQPEVTLPAVIVVPEMAKDKLSRLRAGKLIGRVATGTIELESVEETKPTSLMVGIHEAVKGNEQALNLVMANTKTDVIERTIKSGHVMQPILLLVDSGGRISQHGQSLENVHENTLRHASSKWQMRERAEAETRNAFRMEDAVRQGLLEDYYFVVFSRPADNMSKQELKDAGFFEDTMTVAIQATTLDAEGLTTTPAFVAGVKEPGGEQHDEQTIVKIGEAIGVDFSDKSSTEIIDMPVLIHKSLMPNGVIDLVKLYDDVAGGTFFGENKPRQDYLEYLEFCKEREASYAPKIQKIMGELLADYRNIRTPLDAVRRLHELSEKNMVDQAIYDTSINPMVFGPEAAELIKTGRLHHDLGNFELAQAAARMATTVAKSYSCPSDIKVHEKSGGDSGVAEGEGPAPESETWYAGKKYFNSKCNCCKKIKREVGACHICESCFNDPQKMQKAYEEEMKAETPLAKIYDIAKIRETRRSKKSSHESPKAKDGAGTLKVAA